MSTIFTSNIFIPFHLADPGGILFFGNIFTLAHQSYEQMVSQKLKIAWADWFQNPDWIVPIKEASATYHGPIFAGQDCRVEIRFTQVRSSSFEVTYDLFQNDVNCSTVKTVHVFCCRHTGKKCPIPDSLHHKIVASS